MLKTIFGQLESNAQNLNVVRLADEGLAPSAKSNLPNKTNNRVELELFQTSPKRAPNKICQWRPACDVSKKVLQRRGEGAVTHMFCGVNAQFSA
jgi:glutamyl-tRNA reductase